MTYDGVAVVYCEGAFATTYGKTAHGLVRFTERYHVAAVIDSTLAGKDAGEFLDHRKAGIPIVASLEDALSAAEATGEKATHFVVGIATDGGFLDPPVKAAALQALSLGLNVDSGLHEFISDLPEAQTITSSQSPLTGNPGAGPVIRDVRKSPAPGSMHAFTGKIEEISSRRVAVLGTDSAIGKRTTAWILVHAMREQGVAAELIGTGQTAWMQGARFSIVLDSLLNDYVSGELEHACWRAWKEQAPDFLIIEGQGSLMNPGYPGGFEILAACRPQGIVLQHAPARKEYDGFPGYPLDSLKDQIHAIEFLSKKPVVAITVNHEGIPREDIDRVCKELEDEQGLPVVDPLVHGAQRLVPVLLNL